MKFKKLMTAKSVRGLILRIIIMAAIPYIYLLACGFIFDKWLHLYSAVSFIFWSLMGLWTVALVLSILSVVWFVQYKKENDRV